MRAKRRRYHRSKPTPRTVYVPAKPQGARRLARTDEACAYGKFSRATLFRLIDKKIIKAYKQSHKVILIDLDSIDAFQNSLPEVNHANG
jgi:hypothetical protein